MAPLTSTDASPISSTPETPMTTETLRTDTLPTDTLPATATYDLDVTTTRELNAALQATEAPAR